MKITLFYRFRLIYTAFFCAVLSLCLQLPSVSARSMPLSSSGTVSALPVLPCSQVAFTVSQSSFGAFMKITIENTSAMHPAFLTGFSFQWGDLSPVRLKQVSTFEPVGTIWMNSMLETSLLITGTAQAPEWLQTVEIPPNSALPVFFVFETPIDTLTAFSGSLTFSCNRDDDTGVTAGFGPLLSPSSRQNLARPDF